MQFWSSSSMAWLKEMGAAADHFRMFPSSTLWYLQSIIPCPAGWWYKTCPAALGLFSTSVRDQTAGNWQVPYEHYESSGITHFRCWFGSKVWLNNSGHVPVSVSALLISPFCNMVAHSKKKKRGFKRKPMKAFGFVQLFIQFMGQRRDVATGSWQQDGLFRHCSSAGAGKLSLFLYQELGKGHERSCELAWKCKTNAGELLVFIIQPELQGPPLVSGCRSNERPNRSPHT